MSVAQAAKGKFVHFETTHDESCCRHDDTAPLSNNHGNSNRITYGTQGRYKV
jgi:hypothetical protein